MNIKPYISTACVFLFCLSAVHAQQPDWPSPSVAAHTESLAFSLSHPAPATETGPAAADSANRGTLTAYWENDGTFIKANNDTDRHYTSGFALGFAHQPQWAEELAPYMPFAEQFGPARTAAGYIVGQFIHTPQGINQQTVIADDLPYSGYIFAGVYWQRSNEATLDHFQLDLGMVGPSSQAEEVQRVVHDMVGIRKLRGWDNQLHDEPTIQLYLRKKWRHEPVNLPVGGGHEMQFQVIPQVGAAVGTVHRHISGDITARLGVNLPDDFGPGRLADVGSATAPAEAGRLANPLSLYGYARVGGRAVEHNIFISGNTFKSSHFRTEEHFVGEVQLGVSLQYDFDPVTFELTYSQTFVSEQFEGQDGSDAYGALTLSAQMWF